MSKNGDIYLGIYGNEVLLSPFGRKLIITDEEIGREQRTASGRLVKDITAVKKNFKLNYELIDDSALETFLDLYELQQELTLLIYNSTPPITTHDENDYLDRYTVLMSPIARERLLVTSDGLWSGVVIELKEV